MNRLKKTCAALVAGLAFLTGGAARGGTFTDGDGNTWTSDGGIITGVTIERTTMTMPSAIDGVDITAFGAAVFQGKERVVRVTIPAGITAIPNQAFLNCKNLKGVTINATAMTSIGYQAFMGCVNLETFVIPNSVTTLGKGVFSGCSALEEVTIGDGVTTLTGVGYNGPSAPTNGSSYGDDMAGASYNGMFYNCTSLKTINWGKGVKTIGNVAFLGCSALEKVEIPDTVTSVGYHAFYKCSGLGEVKIGAKVTTIGRWAFRGDGNLTKVTLGGSETEIMDQAFENCVNLQNFELPATIQYLRYRCFAGCSKALTAVTIPTNRDELETELGQGVFSGCTKLATVTIGDTVKTLTGVGYNGPSAPTNGSSYGDDMAGASYNGLFYNCTSLKTINWGKGVKTIGNIAFLGCTALEKVALPESVDTIGNHAFYGCSKLTTVIAESSINELGRRAFGNDPALGKVFFKGPAMDFAPGAEPFAFDSAELTVYAAPGSTGWTGVADVAGLPADGKWCGVNIAYGSPTEADYPTKQDEPPVAVKYTVTFVVDAEKGSAEGELVQEVESGKDAVAPVVTAKEGWKFKEWDRAFDSVEADMTVTAVWEEDDQPGITPGDHPYYVTQGAWYAIRQSAVYDPGPGSILEWEVEETVKDVIGTTSYPVTNEGWYDIYRDGVKIDSVHGSGYYRDLGAKAGEVHAYVVYGYFGTGVVTGAREVRCPMNYSLTVSPTNVTATAEGGEMEISVKALKDEWSNQWTSLMPDGSTLTQSGEYRLVADQPADWKAKTDSKWITLVNDVGNGESVLKIRAAANDSKVARAAVVTVAPGQVWELAKKVFVIQEAKSEEPTPVEPTVYAIAYELDGGVNAEANPLSFTTNDLPITLAAPTKEGFDFLGWTPNGGVIAVGTASNVAFTATWKEIESEEDDPEPEVEPVDLTKVNAWSAAYGEDGVLTVVAAKGKAKKGVTTSALTVKLTVGKKVYTYKGGVLNEDGTVTLPTTPNGAPALADLVLDGEGIQGVIGGQEIVGWKAVKPTLEELDLPETAIVGVGYAAKVVLSEASYPVKFSAKKLPGGLKINALTGEITGVPTKVGAFAATVTAVSTLDKTLKTEIPVKIVVEALPAWAQGTFNGGGAAGQATITIGKNGKISGKYQYSDGGKAYTAKLTAKAFVAYDEETTNFIAVVDCKIGKAEGRLLLAVSPDPFFSSAALCLNDDGAVIIETYRNRWGEADRKALGKVIANKTLTLASGVTLKFAANGTVKATALAVVNKAKLSCSTVFVPFENPPPTKDDMGGVVFVYFPAKGAFAGYSEMAFLIWNGEAFEEYVESDD